MICLYLPRCWSTTINNGYRRKWIRETTLVCFVWLVPQLLPLLCKTHASAQKCTAQRFVEMVLPARSQAYSVCCKLAFLALPSSALVSHPVSLSPSNRIRMSGIYLCITGISRRTKSPIVLPPFPNIRIRAVPSSLKPGGPHSGISASLPVNLPALTARMTANDHRKDHADSTTVLNNEV